MTHQEQGMMELGEIVAASIPPQFDFICIVYPKRGVLPHDPEGTNLRSMAYVTSDLDKARCIAAGAQLPNMLARGQKLSVTGGPHS